MTISIAAAKPVNTFARFTATHTLVSMQIPPSGQYLFQWLLQQKPAGREQEIDLKEFQTFTGLGRKKPYCFKQVRSALNSLIEAGLVDPIRHYSARFWKVIAYHPGQKEAGQEEKKFSPLETETSQKQLSKPYPTVPSYREYRETTNTASTINPVQEVERQGVNFEVVLTPIGLTEEKKSVLEQYGKSGKTEQEKSEEKESPLIFSGERKIDPQLKKQVEEVIAPVPMNPQIKKAVLAASLEAVQDAISVVQQRKEAGRVKNPAGLFVKAVKEQWKPSAGKDHQSSTLKSSDGFTQWFDAARAAGIVIGSQVINGQIWVYDAKAKTFPYEQMALLHPLESFMTETSIIPEKELLMFSLTPNEPLDFSDVLAIIDTQFSRLRWSAERVREFLVQTYGKCSRALLADTELIDLQARLQIL